MEAQADGSTRPKARRGMSRREVLDLPVLIPLQDAARAWGISESSAAELRAAGRFPVEVVQVGRLYRVRRADLLKSLNLEDPE